MKMKINYGTTRDSKATEGKNYISHEQREAGVRNL
jgi:hypothetical protein